MTLSKKEKARVTSEGGRMHHPSINPFTYPFSVGAEAAKCQGAFNEPIGARFGDYKDLKQHYSMLRWSPQHLGTEQVTFH